MYQLSMLRRRGSTDLTDPRTILHRHDGDVMREEKSSMSESADEVTEAEALFVSDLQSSDVLDGNTVNHTVTKLLQRDGPSLCAARMAYEFGEHPDTAPRRMRWARDVVRQVLHAPAAPAT
jgi:hypothetical protein